MNLKVKKEIGVLDRYVPGAVPRNGYRPKTKSRHVEWTYDEVQRRNAREKQARRKLEGKR